MLKDASWSEKLEFYGLIAQARKVHGPYKRQDGRQIVILVNDDGSRRTVSYPKFLMEEHMGRELDPDKETVDHWDSNFENNDLNNLRIVPREQHSADDTRRVKPAKLKCAWCKKKFERSPRLLRDKAKKNKAGPFCSRGCAGKYSRNLQLKLIDKFDTQPAMDSKYYKKKYVEAMNLLQGFVIIAMQELDAASAGNIIKSVMERMNVAGYHSVQEPVELYPSGSNVSVYFQVNIKANQYELAQANKAGTENLIKQEVKTALENNFQANDFHVSFSYLPVH